MNIDSDSEKSDFSFDGDLVHDNNYGKPLSPSLIFLNFLVDPEFNPLISDSGNVSPMTIAELKTNYMRDVILTKRLNYTHDKNLM